MRTNFVIIQTYIRRCIRKIFGRLILIGEIDQLVN